MQAPTASGCTGREKINWSRSPVCTTFVCDRQAGEAPQDECRRSWDRAPTWGLEETTAEKTEVACHTDCLALVRALNEAHLFRIHIRQMLRRGGKKWDYFTK